MTAQHREAARHSSPMSFRSSARCFIAATISQMSLPITCTEHIQLRTQYVIEMKALSSESKVTCYLVYL
eukprot:6196869-Pleurochrysis_carterae.AAC.1